MVSTKHFSKEVLSIDAPRVASTIADVIRGQIGNALRRKGAVVALSGGIDSSVVTALCVRALGADRVHVLLMPERHSSPEALTLGLSLISQLGVSHTVEDIGRVLDAAGCYDRQTEAVRRVFPDFGEGYRFKITLPSLIESNRLNVSELTIQAPSGEQKTSRMPAAAYLQLVAATNFKQRVRKVMEYYHADRLNYAVAGTPNRLEYDQGFFVKLGDGAADLKPIAHLYKTQVYALAEFLHIPEEIRRRPPTTDTFSLPQSQEEFYFSVPYEAMDLCLYGRNHNVDAADVATAIGLSREQVARIYKDIDQKRRSTRYLHEPPMLVEPVLEASR